jgi:large subunit ribosomal protein L10
MSVRPEKQSIVAEIRQQVEGGRYCLVVDYKGLSVAKLTDLRGRLRGTGGRLQVVSNAFFRIAAGQAGWPEVSSLLEGATAIVTGSGDGTQAAKSLRDFKRDNSNLPALKGGLLSGRVLGRQDVESLASLPPREVLLGMLVGTVAAPMSQLVGVLSQKLASLIYVLKAIEDKKSKQA